jgi:hypothetical protein
MKSKARTHILILIFLCAGMPHANAQEKLPAKEAFAVLEARFNLRFSYLENDLEGVLLNLPNAELTLDQTLAELTQHPFLLFKKIDDSRVAVALKQNNHSLCIQLLDAVTQEPLIGASALILPDKGAVSDAGGKIQLTNLSLDEIVALSFLGYETQQHTLRQLLLLSKGCITIALKEAQFELNEVVVSNLFTTGLDQRLDGSIDFNTKSFGMLPGLIETDVLQMIQVLPGVQSVNESIADINIRGGSHDQNLLLWDDIKMYHSGHFFGLISAFNPELTKEVTVVKNGSSAQYSEGVSGSIIMQSKNQIDANFKGSMGVNLLSANAVLEVPLSKKLALHISGRRALTDVYDSPAYDKYFERSFQDSRISQETAAGISSSSNFYFYDVSAKLLYDINEKHSFRSSLLQVHNELAYTETAEDNGSQATSTSNISQDNFAAGLNLKSRWSKAFNTELQAYYTNYYLEALDVSPNSEQRLLQLNEVVESGLKLNTTSKLSDSWVWLNGYQYTETGTQNASDVVNPTYQIIKKRVQRNHGLYSEFTHAKKGFYMRAGARLNYFERFGSFLLEPRLNINQALSQTMSIKLLGEFKNQSITQFVDLNEDFLGVENRRWLVSDTQSIPLIKSRQLSVGIAYKNKGWFIELSPYYKEVDGLITESQEFTTQNQYDGFVGSSTAMGVEFLINKRIAQSNIWLAYTYSDQEYEFLEITSEKFPSNFNISHALHFAGSTHLAENWKISAGLQARSGRPYTQPVAGSETYQDGNF